MNKLGNYITGKWITGDGDGQVCDRGGAVLVARGVAEHVGGDLAEGQRIGVGIGVVEGIDVAAIGLERQRSIDPGHRNADLGGIARNRPTCSG